MAGESVLCELEVDASGALVDSRASQPPLVSGGTAVHDERFGQVLEFGDAGSNEIRIKDGGRFDFTPGFTFECWLHFDAASAAEIQGGFFSKPQTAVTEIKNGQIDVKWMIFPRSKVFATGKQLGYYPTATENFNGARELPTGQWVHVALTYDPGLRVIRTWLDRAVDRTRYIVREEPLPLQSNPGSPVSLFKGMKNFKVAGVKIASAPREYSPLPSMEVYIHELPYHGKGEAGLVIDHIRPDLPFPVEVTVYWENHTGKGSTIQRLRLEDARRKTFTFPLPGWKNAPYTMIVQAFSENRPIFSKEVRMANTEPGKEAPVTLLPDGGLTIHGKRRFPLLLYHVLPEDFETVKGLGFNAVKPRDPKLRFVLNPDEKWEKMNAWFKAAEKADLMLMPAANYQSKWFLTRSAQERRLLAWAAADEPWGASLERLRESYVACKLMARDVPVYIVQNNSSRVQETAEGCDIIARDPYPIPLVSLRLVADQTRQTIRDTGGLKPVWIILPQYRSKLPSYEELRCMAYLAIVAGANGLGIYAWDDRVASSSEAASGWYTGEHPEQVEILGKVMKELASIEEEILITPNSEEAVRFEPPNEALHGAIKSTPGGRYLLLVSDSRQNEEARVSLPGIGNARLKSRFEPGETLEIHGGSAPMEFAPYAVKVFRIEP